MLKYLIFLLSLLPVCQCQCEDIGIGTYDPLTGCLIIQVPIEVVISDKLNKPVKALTSQDYESVKELDIKGFYVNDISKIALCKNLHRFRMTALYNLVSDISPLAELPSLEVLSIAFWDPPPINYDFSPLSRIKSLKRLDIHSLKKFDAALISNLDNLEWLGITSDSISNLDSLSGLSSLKTLLLSTNQINDIGFIFDAKDIENISILGDNDISSIQGMEELHNLKSLYISYNNITDIQPLLYLKELWHVGLYGNPLSDKAIYEDIPALEARGVRVNYDKPEDYDPSRVKLPDDATNDKSKESD